MSVVLSLLVLFGCVAAMSCSSAKNAAVVKTGDTVKVDYTGKLENGTVFDSSEGKQPLEFEVGAGQMISGFDKGVIGMKVGQTKTLTLPPEEAYGAQGTPDGTIPPNSTLIFDVTLVGIVPK
jgi:FKBP-type peptidyl-prolyl cis-trans isomerase